LVRGIGTTECARKTLLSVSGLHGGGGKDSVEKKDEVPEHMWGRTRGTERCGTRIVQNYAWSSRGRWDGKRKKGKREREMGRRKVSSKGFF